MNTADSTALACTGPPRILLVEDDPTSSAFLSAVLRGIPAVVDCADTATAARSLAAARRFDLWLLDMQLPDGSGIELLAQLRASDPNVPAVAHTASTEAALHASLIEAGFAQVLVKPLSANQLQIAVQRALGLPSAVAISDTDSPLPSPLPLWDDEAAGRAMNFNRVHLDALRELFIGELPQARQTILAGVNAGDPGVVSAALHRLQASCGFVGAARLRAAVIGLHKAPLDPALAIVFDQVALATAAMDDASQSVGSNSASLETPDSGA
ncbi:MAG: response regulator [Lysobacter sp.]|nr:response regulator [Lysobacter sp.]